MTSTVNFIPAEINSIHRLHLHVLLVAEDGLTFLLAQIFVQAQREVSVVKVGLGIEAFRNVHPSQGELAFVTIRLWLQSGVAIGECLSAQVPVLPWIRERHSVIAALVGNQFRSWRFRRRTLFARQHDGPRLRSW